MFTGIVTELGTITRIEGNGAGCTIEIEAPRTVADLVVGDSVALDGVCLTAVSVGDGRFTVQAVAETLARSTLGTKTSGDDVDLERPMSASGRFDGHLVQGHVDGVGEVIEASMEGESRRVRVGIALELAGYVVEKGSVAVDGVSLTLTAVSAPHDTAPWIEFVLIPHTLVSTVLGGKEPGSRVNIEVDVMAKYMERWMEVRR